jgi:hypothetical protein
MNWINRIDFQRWTMANFIVLAFLGVVLRYIICFPAGKLNYLFILHAHSHFAFAGWIFMALAILLIRQIPEADTPSFKWVLLLSLTSSFGMLISFSLQGYKAISIVFSTLFLVVTYRFGFLIINHLKNQKYDIIFSKLIKAAVFFLVISSLGPLALGALKASGNMGIIYQNSIYFYLHFQMNGWMLFGVLALVAKKYLNADISTKQGLRLQINSFILSSVPLFFIFTLWSHPPQWVYLIALCAALINAGSWFALLFKLRSSSNEIPSLVKFALAAISLKVIFQILVCIPPIGEWTFANRNLIIGYVHLLTLGAITPVIINEFCLSLYKKASKYLNGFYTALTLIYLALLFIQPLFSVWKISIPYYQHYLLAVSILYCMTGIFYFRQFFCKPLHLTFSHRKSLNQILYESNH